MPTSDGLRAPISASAGTPETVLACWKGAWDGYEPQDRTEELERLSAAIDFAFNTPDGDGDQGSLLEESVLAAAAYIEAQPCTCTEFDPCPRCHALNRWRDVPMER